MQLLCSKGYSRKSRILFMEWDLMSGKGLLTKFSHNTLQDDHIKKCPTKTLWTPAGLGTSLWAVALESNFLNRNFKKICTADFEDLSVSHILCEDSAAYDREKVCECLWITNVVSHKNLVWFTKQVKLLLTNRSSGPPEKNQVVQRACCLVVQEDTNITAKTPTSWLLIFFLWCCLGACIGPDCTSALLGQTQQLA